MNWKQLFSIFFYIMLSFLPTISADGYSLWDEGIAAYSQGDIVRAEKYFEDIENKGYGPWHMLGIIAEQKKEYVRALIAFAHAQKEASPLLIHDAVTNLLRVQNALNQETNVWLEYFKTTLFAIPPIILQLFFILFWIATMYFLTQKSFHGLTVIFFAISIGVFFLYIFQTILSNPMFAYVRQNSSLYIGPSQEYQVRKNIKAGEKIMIEKEKDEWLKVTHENNKGWLMADVVEKV